MNARESARTILGDAAEIEPGMAQQVADVAGVTRSTARRHLFIALEERESGPQPLDRRGGLMPGGDVGRPVTAASFLKMLDQIERRATKVVLTPEQRADVAQRLQALADALRSA